MRRNDDFMQFMTAVLAIVIFALLLVVACRTVAYAEEAYEPVYTEVKTKESADLIWEELSKYTPNDMITAGIMGYFFRESGFRSDAIGGYIYFNLGRETDICQEFTETVDKGLHDRSSWDYYEHMISDIHGGYGLGQWLSPNYLEHFYEFIREREGSIGDARLQCEFVVESMKRNEKLWAMLLEDKTAADCGRHIGIFYDGTSMHDLIADYANEFYEEYA